MKYDLAVSIVTYHNDVNILSKAIDSVLDSTINARVTIVDNSSTNAIGNWVSGRYKENTVSYKFNNANLGYGKAHNLAMQRTIENAIPYHLVLNPDVWFDDNVLVELFKYMQDHQEIGNIMPKILYGNGEEQYLCKLTPTPFDLIFRRFLPFKGLKEKMNDKYELRFSGYNQIMEVPILSGCFMFLRTKTIKTVGLFDDRYFMYLEDVDLSRRIHQKNKTIFYPDVTIYHGYAKESYANPKLLKYHIKSAISYFNKWGWFFDKERRVFNNKVLANLTD